MRKRSSHESALGVGQVPDLLPTGLLAQRARTSGLLLGLDYDGTLAEITSTPELAWPMAGVCESLTRLSDPKLSASIAVVVITGRRICDVQRLLGVSLAHVFFSGVHGLEVCEPGASPRFTRESVECLSELATVRSWLDHHVPRERGFRVEDKEIAVGLHFRDAAPALFEPLCREFASFVTKETPRLKLLRLKMLVEALPREADKGHAIEQARLRVPGPFVPVFFGDDQTDEDVFEALDANGIGVMVGSARASLARWRVDGPSAVARELKELKDALAPPQESVSNSSSGSRWGLK
jgi:trehalose-phosphatase